MKKNISEKEYIFYMDNFPIVCTDIVFLNKSKTKTLLFKRTNKPAMGKYYTCGGRILKNETFEKATLRKTKEETGIILNPKKLIWGGVINEIYKDSKFKEVSYHAVTLYWGYIIEEDTKIKLDTQNSQSKWFSVDDPKLHPSIKQRVRVVLKNRK